MPATSPTISEPDTEIVAELDRQRAWVADAAGEATGGDRIAAIAARTADAAVLLQAVDAVLQRGTSTLDSWQQQALGVALGDALAQRLDVAWVVVDDEYGRDPALHIADGPVLVFPRTMISKRIERGDPVRAVELFLTVCRDLAPHL